MSQRLSELGGAHERQSTNTLPSSNNHSLNVEFRLLVSHTLGRGAVVSLPVWLVFKPRLRRGKGPCLTRRNVWVAGK